MAYRTAEQTRWQQFDFVVGYEVKTTQNGTHKEDICDELAGKYPKDFVFTGWHPQCMCYTIPILKTEEEFWADDSENSTESVNEVTDVPDGFKDWIEENKERIEKAEEKGALPYFIKDNQEMVEDIFNPKLINEENNGVGYDWESIIRNLSEDDHYEIINSYFHGDPRARRAFEREWEDDIAQGAIEIIKRQQDAEYPDYLQLDYYLYKEMQKSMIVPEGFDNLFDIYKGGYYKQFNSDLRQGKIPANTELLQALDNITLKNKLPANLILSRNVGTDFMEATFGIKPGTSADKILEMMNQRVGTTFADKAFISTSGLADNTAMSHLEYKLKILAPKGSNGYISSNIGEREVLLPRGQQFEIVGVKKFTNLQGRESVELIVKIPEQAETAVMSKKKTPLEIAAERHAARTDADVERIQKAWNNNRMEHLMSLSERIGSYKDPNLRDVFVLLEDDIANSNLIAFKNDYKQAKQYIDNKIKTETKVVRKMMQDPEMKANLQEVAHVLGVDISEPMTFFEANELRGNPNYSASEAYRINCQTCVVANELRRRGLNLEALANTKGSWLEKLSRGTNEIWRDADGNIPEKALVGARKVEHQNKYTGKTWNTFEKTVSNRKQLIAELENAIIEDGRYHIDWCWNTQSKRKITGHIITVERIDGVLRYYDPQNGKVIPNFYDYINDIQLKRGINLLRVDNLRVNPEFASHILGKSGSEVMGGEIVRSGIGVAESKKLAKQNAISWIENNFNTVIQPNGTSSYQETINGITVTKTFINETFAKNIHNKSLEEIMELTTDVREWVPKGKLVRIEEGRHHPYPFKVYEVEYKGKVIEYKTKDIEGEPLYTMRIKK